jgi:uncharacterized membrane protein
LAHNLVAELAGVSTIARAGVLVYIAVLAVGVLAEHSRVMVRARAQAICGGISSILTVQRCAVVSRKTIASVVLGISLHYEIYRQADANRDDKENEGST